MQLKVELNCIIIYTEITMSRPFEIDRETNDVQTVKSPASNIQIAEVHSDVNHSGLSFVDSDFPACVE